MYEIWKHVNDFQPTNSAKHIIYVQTNYSGWIWTLEIIKPLKH